MSAWRTLTHSFPLNAVLKLSAPVQRWRLAAPNFPALARASLCATGLLVLGGCAFGNGDEAPRPTLTFDVPVEYTAAYRRAREFVRVCHVQAEFRYGVTYGSNRSLVDKTATGELTVFKIPEERHILETIRVQPAGPRAAKVTITVDGQGKWDALEMAAARASIESATPVCREDADRLSRG